MKQLALFSLLSILFIGTTNSCQKEDTPDVYEPDSGYYNPTAYFPLKWGAEWVYETSDGDTFQVDCGPHYIDTLYEGNTLYLYEYHMLNTGSGSIGKLADIVPHFSGTKYWNGAIVGNACIKGSPYSKAFMADGNVSPGHAFKTWLCGSAGPEFDEYCIALDSGIQIDGYSNVFSFCYEYRQNLNLVPDTLKSQANSTTRVYHLPILPKAGLTMGKVYYAQGVGVIRKELIDDQGQVLDYIRLVSYYFP